MNSLFSLKGRNAWVTGAAYGIGFAIAKAFVEAGVDNIFGYVDRTPHGLHLGTNTPGRTVYASLSVRFHQGKKITNQYKSNLNERNNEEN